MNDALQNRARLAAAVVPLSLFILAWITLTPPAWVDALKRSIASQPGAVVIDDDVPYDPSDLKGLVWVPRSALKKRLMKKVERVLWVRAAETQGGDLHGYAPKDCRKAHGVQLCLVVATTPKTWRLSDNLTGLKAKTSQGSCTHAGGDTRCSYGKANWEYVRRESHRFSGKEKPCIWTHPVADEPVLVTTPKLGKGTYRWGAGVTDQGIKSGLPDVRLALRAGTAPPMQLQVGSQSGFKMHAPFELDADTSLTLRVSAPSTGARFLCWNLHRVP